jgi:hypothetical chaperone protein
MLGVGIDFGTSNSSVALFDGHELRYVSVDDASELSQVMPTALYLDRSRSGTIGQAAIDAYLRENTGRLIELRKEEVGTIEITVAGGENIRGAWADGGAITDTFAVHAFTDVDLPGRLFRSLKRWLGNSRVQRVRVFDGQYRIVALITPILEYLRERAEIDTGEGPIRVYVGRPVVFQGRDPDTNPTALRRLREACEYAQLREATLYPEPVAAALSYLRSREQRAGETLLSFDFGGGTLDLCALRTAEQGFQILATHGIPLGGDVIDAQIYREKVFPELGDGVDIEAGYIGGPARVPFPFDRFAEPLLNWQLAHELNTSENRELIARGAREPGEAGKKLKRLYELVRTNQSYRVLRAVERAKVELSDCDATRIRVAELDLDVPFARRDFETLLEPFLREIRQAVWDALRAASLRDEQVDAVVCTGGSSRIPAVRRALDELLPGRVVEHDTFTSIAAGLAIASHAAYESPLASEPQ